MIMLIQLSVYDPVTTSITSNEETFLPDFREILKLSTEDFHIFFICASYYIDDICISWINSTVDFLTPDNFSLFIRLL